jgi:ABC-2 type transport system ATP-binding protein
MSSDWVLDLKNVSKTYGRGRRGVRALRGVSLAVRPGEIFGLLGPNGAGKSTLVKIMMTVVRPDSAEGIILGERIGSKKALARVGYLPEHHRFPRYLTGRQLLEFFGSLAGVDCEARKKRAAELLDLVGMSQSADRKVEGYSKGMMQRVGLAQALMNDPQLVVLDEPTDGVDPIGRQEIREVLLRLRSEGRTVFLNSHLLSELELICDRVAIMVQGQVVKHGTIGELAAHRQWYEVEIDGGDELAATFGLDTAGKGALAEGIWLESQKRDAAVVLKIGTADPAQVQNVVDRLRANQRVIRRMELVRPTLEALFMEAVNGVKGEREVKP